MESRELTSCSRHMQWLADIEDRKSSGLTVKEWCKTHNLLEKTYYYRHKIVMNVVCTRINNEVEPVRNNAPEFAKIELSGSGQSGIHIETTTVNIHISPNSNTEHVKLVLEAMSCA